jgi:hypothetical protein
MKTGKVPAIVVLLLSFFVLSESALAIPKYSGGAGTAGSPYKIGSAADLLVLAADANDYNKHFILTADINLASYNFTTAVIAPDGNNANASFEGTAFTGVFDGNSHTISNLTIDSNSAGNDYLGLFGLSSGGEIKNLGLKDVNIAGDDNSIYLGGLVGYNEGSISNCHSTGAVTGGDNSQYLGGLAGINGGSISNCYSTSTVTSGDNSSYLGGLAGLNGIYGNTSNCYSTGAVSGGNGSTNLGGLVGYNNGGNISNCYSTGAVTGGSSSFNLGGLAGYNDSGNISNCYSTGETSGTSNLGGLVGVNDGNISRCYFPVTEPNNGFGTPLTDANMKQQSSFVGWDFVGETVNGPNEIWWINKGVSFPKLFWQLDVAKCTVTAGSKESSDKISFSGTMCAKADDFNDANAVNVVIDSNDIVNPCDINFPIDANTFKKGKYNYSKTANSITKSFAYDLKTHKFAFSAGKLDLSGLGCPVTIGIDIGDYYTMGEIDEVIVNGPKVPIPILLMMGVKNALRVDKCQVKQGKKPNSDQLSVKGEIAVEDINDSNLAGEDVVITWGGRTFTIQEGGFKAAKTGKSYKCSKVNATEGGVVSAQINFDMCSFMITITDTNASPVDFESGVEFGISFAPSFDEIAELNLPYIVNYAFDYLGDYLTPQLITYTDKADELVQVSGFPGQVQLFVTTETTARTIQTFAHANGGSVIAQVPSLGYYLVSAAPGNEANFIAVANADANVLLAIPNMPLATASDVVDLSSLLGPHGELPVIPIFGSDPSVGGNTYLYVSDTFVTSAADTTCKDGYITHGAGVSYLASHSLAGTGEQLNIGPVIAVGTISATTSNDCVAANRIALDDIASHRSGRAVVNISRQGSPMCPGDICCSEEIYRDHEAILLERLALQMDALSDKLLQQTVFVISAGNGVCNGTKGLDLSAEIETLHDRFPRIFGLDESGNPLSGDGPHMLIVGGQGDTSGTYYDKFNYAKDPEDDYGNPLMVYAPARDVPLYPVGGDICTTSGTSFAAPAVSSLIAQVLSTHPNLTVGQVTYAVMEAARKNGYWMPTVEMANAELETTLSIATAGLGSGTVTANPPPNEPGGTYTMGTVVTLTAKAYTGSTFTNWSGDVTGTAKTVKIKMDWDKSVTAAFAKSTAAAKYVGVFIGSTTSNWIGCVFQHAVSGTGTITIPSTGAATFKVSGVDHITVLSGEGCTGSTKSASYSGPLTIALNGTDVSTHIDNDAGTADFDGTINDDHTITGTLTLDTFIFDHPITGPLNLNQQ